MDSYDDKHGCWRDLVHALLTTVKVRLMLAEEISCMVTDVLADLDGRTAERVVASLKAHVSSRA